MRFFRRLCVDVRCCSLLCEFDISTSNIEQRCVSFGDFALICVVHGCVITYDGVVFRVILTTADNYLEMSHHCISTGTISCLNIFSFGKRSLHIAVRFFYNRQFSTIPTRFSSPLVTFVNIVLHTCREMVINN